MIYRASRCTRVIDCHHLGASPAQDAARCALVAMDWRVDVTMPDDCDGKLRTGLRVENQWRICFRWDGSNAYDVEIVDDH